MRNKDQSSSWPCSFRDAFCQRLGYSTAQYERAVFWRCLYRHALPVALFMHRWSPQFFREDFDLIREVGDVRRPEIFKVELNWFYGRNLRDKNWIRRSFAIRVSAKRLLRLKNRVFAQPIGEPTLPPSSPSQRAPGRRRPSGS